MKNATHNEVLSICFEKPTHAVKQHKAVRTSITLRFPCRAWIWYSARIIIAANGMVACGVKSQVNVTEIAFSVSAELVLCVTYLN